MPLAPPVFNLAGDAPKWPPPAPWWMTADSDPDDGEPHDFVEVWTERPHRHVTTGVAGAFWLSRPEDMCWDVGTRYGRYTRASMLRWLGTVPDDDNQIIRVD